MKKKFKAIIFGGSGFLGSHLSELLYKKNFQVTIYDIKKINLRNKAIKFIKGSITNKKKVMRLTKGYDYVFNFAAISDISKANVNPTETINQNFLGNVNILEAIKKQKNVKRFIFASSIYAISSQGEFYSSTKRSSENIIENYSRKYGIKFSILRYGSIYGTRSGSLNTIHNFILQGLLNKKIIRKGLGNEIRSYINVKDATKITLKVLNKKFTNKYINIIGKNKLKVKEVINLIKNKLNLKKIIFKKNEKLQYHYNKSPYSYKFEKGITIHPIKPISLNKGMDEIINEISS
tara:strand:- start:865 stop:1740 length:876 start_codon:yes stop_codon:yes gene_type:complete